jgi:hypothetical protein
MIAPCNSKTAFLPAVQQKCPEKAVFVFRKRTALETKAQWFAFWYPSPESLKLISKYSGKLIYDATKSWHAFRLPSKDSRPETCRRRYIPKNQIGKNLSIISDSAPAKSDAFLNEIPLANANGANRPNCQRCDYLPKLTKIAIDQRNEFIIQRKGRARKPRVPIKTTDGKAMN